MKQPLVSIIIPGYNVENYVSECFESLRNQTYDNLELIFINDGSKDRTGGLFDEFAHSMKNATVIHQENAGLSAARNAGLVAVHGDYVMFLDSDDYLANDAVEYLVGLAQKHNSKLAICPHIEKYENGEQRDFNAAKLHTGEWSIEETLYNCINERGSNLQVASKLFAKELFDGVQFPVGKLHEDVGVLYKTVLNCDTKVIFSSKPKYFYNIRGNSITNSGFSFRKLDLIELTDEMCDAVDEKYPSLIESTRLRRMHARFSILRMVVVLKDKSEKELALEKEMAKYLREHKDWVLKNEEAGRRDKFAMRSLLLGSGVFGASWRVYKKLRK